MNYNDLRGEVEEWVSPTQSIVDEETAIKRQDMAVSRSGSYTQTKRKSQYGSIDATVTMHESAAPDLTGIPFFHIDLEEAVRAAELRAAGRVGNGESEVVAPSD